MFNTSIDVVITDHMIQTSQRFFNIYAELKDNSIVVSQNTWQFYTSNNIVDLSVRLRLVNSIFWLDVHRHTTDKANLMTFPKGKLILDWYRQLLQIMWAIEKSVHLANYAQSSWRHTWAKGPNVWSLHVSWFPEHEACLGVLLLPPGQNASPSEGYPKQYVAGTHLYTWMKRDKVE